jgi:hypothetical protein
VAALTFNHRFTAAARNQREMEFREKQDALPSATHSHPMEFPQTGIPVGQPTQQSREFSCR